MYHSIYNVKGYKMELKLNREQRMLLIRSIWANLGEHEQYLKDDRFIKEKVNETIDNLKQLETLLWNGENI